MLRLSVVLVLTFVMGARVGADEVTTTNGSRIVGTLVSVDGGKVVLKTDFAGNVAIPLEHVAAMRTDQEHMVALDDGRRLRGTLGWQDGKLRVEATDGQNTVDPTLLTAAWEPGQPDPTIPPPPPGRKWSYEAFVDMNGKTGNSERFGVGGGAKARLAGPRDSLLFYAQGRSAEENKVKSQEEIMGGIDFEARVAERHSWYVRTELEKDRIEGLDLRSTSALGYGYYLIDRDKQKLRARAGFQYRYESFEDGRTEEAPGLDFGLLHTLSVKDWFAITSEVTYTPSFEDFNDYVIQHESALDIPLDDKDRWKLRLGMSNDYTSILPDPDARRLDTTYFGRLVLSWK